MTDDIKKILEEGATNEKGVSLDIGCGDIHAPGFLGLDIVPSPSVDIVWNAEKLPYPIPASSVSVLLVSHLVEHLKPWLFIDIMNEWWRIAKPNAQLVISTPYAGSPAYWQDPTHVAGFNEKTFAYFDPFERHSGGLLYKVYRPLPWKIKQQHWDMSGNLEVELVKIPDDPSYHKI